MRLWLCGLLVATLATPALARTYAFPHVFDQKGRIALGDGASVFPEIPSDFFGPGSEPCVGTVVLSGDTHVDRIEFGGPTLDTQPATVPIELVQLSLVSAAPIAVLERLADLLPNPLPVTFGTEGYRFESRRAYLQMVGEAWLASMARGGAFVSYLVLFRGCPIGGGRWSSASVE